MRRGGVKIGGSTLRRTSKNVAPIPKVSQVPRPARGGVSHAQGRSQKSGLQSQSLEGGGEEIMMGQRRIFRVHLSSCSLSQKREKKPWAELYSTVEDMYGPRANSPPPFGRCLHMGKEDRERGAVGAREVGEKSPTIQFTQGYMNSK